MRTAGTIVLLAALVAACQPAPMPPPASGSAPPQDAMAPSDVTASDQGAASGAIPPALPPPELEPAEPVANDLGTAIADNWVGTWIGPEGTSLAVAKQEVGYQLTI